MNPFGKTGEGEKYPSPVFIKCQTSQQFPVLLSSLKKKNTYQFINNHRHYIASCSLYATHELKAPKDKGCTSTSNY